MPLISYKCYKFDTIEICFIWNFILFTFTVLPSIGSYYNYAKLAVPSIESDNQINLFI